MGKLKKYVTSKEIYSFAFMLVGCALYALGLSVFLEPRSIVAGGMTGLSIVINIVTKDLLPTGTILIILNAPILLLGIRYCGLKFTVKCFITTAVLGVFIDLCAMIPPITDDPLLSSLYGGILQGAGIGLFIKFEYSSGGTELLGRLVSRWVKIIKIPLCVGILDGIIVVAGAFATVNPTNLLYAAIVIFASTKISETVITGIGHSKLCFIITDKGEEISKTLLENSPRGITMLDGKGMYTGQERNVLVTCVKNRQLTQLKTIVKLIDENAFIIINDSKEVQGKGFDRLGD